MKFITPSYKHIFSILLIILMVFTSTISFHILMSQDKADIFLAMGSEELETLKNMNEIIYEGDRCDDYSVNIFSKSVLNIDNRDELASLYYPEESTPPPRIF